MAIHKLITVGSDGRTAEHHEVAHAGIPIDSNGIYVVVQVRSYGSLALKNLNSTPTKTTVFVNCPVSIISEEIAAIRTKIENYLVTANAVPRPSGIANEPVLNLQDGTIV